jgi:hypothetical protein
VTTRTASRGSIHQVRGRLIFPFLAELAQLDTAATALDPDGAGPLTSGYDPVFREPRVFVQDGVRTVARKEKDLVRVRCQVEPDVFDQLRVTPAGESPRLMTGLFFHFRDLENAGMVDANGEPTIRVNDRLVAIYETNGALVQRVRTPPGLYATAVEPRGLGIGKKRNLLFVRFEERATAAEPGGA